MPIPDSLAGQIHKARVACGKKLQSSCLPMLEMFDCVLTLLKAEHPYALDENRLADFGDRTKIFSLGGIGHLAKFSTGDYAYRLVSQRHLPSFVKFRWTKLTNDNKFFWKFFWTTSESGATWLPLKDFADEMYPAGIPRYWYSSTWWTDSQIFDDVVLGGYRIGMFSEWIKNQVFLLRVRLADLEALQVSHVPTVIDAFMQPVFDPVSELPEPSAGITIDLSEYKKPRKGVNEFVVHPISVELIDFKPVNIDLLTRSKHPTISEEDPDVLTSLLEYYSLL